MNASPRSSVERCSVEMRRGRRGALDAATLLAAGELAAALLPGSRRGPVAALVQRTIDTTPGPLLDFGVATLETADKLVLRTAVVAECAAIGALLPARDSQTRLGWRRPALAGLAAAAAFAIDRAKLRRLDAKRRARVARGAPPSDGNLP